MRSGGRWLALIFVLSGAGWPLAAGAQQRPGSGRADPAQVEPEPAPIEPDPAPLSAPLQGSGAEQQQAPPDKKPEAPATPPDGDVVEIIDTGTGPAAPPPPPAATPPPQDSFSFTGWARARLSIGLRDTGAEATDSLAVPHDRLTAQGQLHLRLRYARGRRFEAIVSGLLTGALYEQDARPPDSFNLFNGDTRGAYEATLREAQIGLFFSRFDLRIGQQRIPWGRGDAFTPNDIINAYDLRDQFLTETEVTRLPTFALRGDLALGPLSLSAVVSPFFQPSKFESYGGNWALIQPDAPASFRSLANQIASTVAVSPTMYPLLQPLMQQTALPPADLTGTAAGLRAQLSLHRIDLDAYYHYGYDLTPALSLSTAFQTKLAQASASSDTSTITSLLLASVASGDVTSTYVRRHHVGLSAALPAGPLLLRGDFAADTQAVLPGADLQGVVKPTVQGVLGIEYQRGELGKALALEAHYLYVVDSPGDSGFLFHRTHNVTLAGLARWTFLRDHLQLEMRALVGALPFSYVLRPQVAVLFRGAELRFGAVVPGGEDSSFGKYYGNNLMVYTMARYSF